MSTETVPAGSPGAQPLDALLTEAGGPTGSRWLPGGAAMRFAAALARHPARPARRAGTLGVELAKVVAGRSGQEPSSKDRRFADPAWTGNPLYRRLCQAYLAGSAAAEGLLDDVDLEWRDQRRIGFLVHNLIDALAPSNLPLQPAAVKVALDTGGANFVRGGRQLVSDLARAPHIPQMVDSSGFTVGGNIAVTEGAVVLRTDVFELIQYAPRTSSVHATPMVMVPPMINKYYVADLAPGRSMIEHFLSAGQPVFCISWRNPTADNREWGLDAYVGAVGAALDAARTISDAPSAHVFGLCAGGITASCFVAHLAAIGEQERVASLTLGVTVLDQSHAGMIGALVDRQAADLAIAQSQQQGFLDGKALAGVFAWLRPNDLIWNYWVNNYLLGKPPPAFDVLFWNSDVTRMPAALHRDFIRMSVDNLLVQPGAVTVLGTPIDLNKITVDSYVVAGIADHICPWTNCYRTTGLLGSPPRFVLSTSGHIAALVNPPGNPKSNYRVSDSLPEQAEAWLEQAKITPGSWWDDWTAWVGERSGGERPAPAALGGPGHAVLDPAPGRYVHET